jgi:hypothetical protein
MWFQAGMNSRLALKKWTLELKAPSIIIPDEFNVILNPLHQDIHKRMIICSITFVYDRWIVK